MAVADTMQPADSAGGLRLSSELEKKEQQENRCSQSSWPPASSHFPVLRAGFTGSCLRRTTEAGSAKGVGTPQEALAAAQGTTSCFAGGTMKGESKKKQTKKRSCGSGTNETWKGSAAPIVGKSFRLFQDSTERLPSTLFSTVEFYRTGGCWKRVLNVFNYTQKPESRQKKVTSLLIRHWHC